MHAMAGHLEDWFRDATDDAILGMLAAMRIGNGEESSG